VLCLPIGFYRFQYLQLFRSHATNARQIKKDIAIMPISISSFENIYTPTIDETLTFSKRLAKVKRILLSQSRFYENIGKLMSKLVCKGSQSKKNKKGGMGRVGLAFYSFSISNLGKLLNKLLHSSDQDNRTSGFQGIK
jgi:hypothetical protein